MAAFSTIALTALAAGAAGSQYAAQRKQARIIRSEGEFAADMLERNAGYAEEQATDAIARGAEAAQGVERDTKRLMGAQRAALAAGGVAITEGDALAVQEEADFLGELDARTVRLNAARIAEGYTREAEDYRLRAQMARRGARNQASAIRTASIGTLLSGASHLASIGFDAGFFNRGGMSQGLSAARDPATIRGIQRTRYR